MLVRPQSVAEDEICSKEKVIESKRQSEDQVERAIRRLRVFKAIRPHAVTNLRQMFFGRYGSDCVWIGKFAKAINSLVQ